MTSHVLETLAGAVVDPDLTHAMRWQPEVPPPTVGRCQWCGGPLEPMDVDVTALGDTKPTIILGGHCSRGC